MLGRTRGVGRRREPLDAADGAGRLGHHDWADEANLAFASHPLVVPSPRLDIAPRQLVDASNMPSPGVVPMMWRAQGVASVDERDAQVESVARGLDLPRNRWSRENRQQPPPPSKKAPAVTTMARGSTFTKARASVGAAAGVTTAKGVRVMTTASDDSDGTAIAPDRGQPVPNDSDGRTPAPSQGVDVGRPEVGATYEKPPEPSFPWMPVLAGAAVLWLVLKKG